DGVGHEASWMSNVCLHCHPRGVTLPGFHAYHVPTVISGPYLVSKRGPGPRAQDHAMARTGFCQHSGTRAERLCLRKYRSEVVHVPTAMRGRGSTSSSAATRAALSTRSSWPEWIGTPHCMALPG